MPTRRVPRFTRGYETAGGMTLIELVFGVAIGLVVLLAVYSVVHLLVVSQRSTDRESSRALAEAQLMETLMQDLRSARTVTQQGADGYRIDRFVSTGGRLSQETQLVTWQVIEGTKIRRQTGVRTQIFDFSKLIDPKDPPFKFQLERVSDVVFKP